MIFAWITAFLMISSRKQMLMVLPILFFAYVYVNRQKFWKSVMFGGLLCILILPCFKVFDCTYNYVIRGSFQGHSSSNRFVTTMIFYNAKASDAQYIADKEVRQIFLEIYDICDEKGYLGKHAGKGWYNEVEHFGAHYDHIQIDTMWPMLAEHAQQMVDSEYTERAIDDIELNTLYDTQTDYLNSVIISAVLPHQLSRLCKTLCNNFLSGLVTTIAQRKLILLPYTIIMYMVYIFLSCRIMLYCRKGEKNGLTDISLAKWGSTLSVVTFLGIFFNVFLVSSVIFCQTRYTIYNMPLFYMTLALLIYVNWKIVKKDKSIIKGEKS